MRLVQKENWSTIINIILHKYFSELTTTCILWHNNFDLNLLTSTNYNVYVHIKPMTLRTYFQKDIYNYTAQEEFHNNNGVYYNDLIKKLIATIQELHCEGFLAFQEDIPTFAESFRKASSYSIWRSIRTRFLFIYVKENQKEDYFQDALFKNQANILIIEADFMNSTVFNLKTNKFVGSLANHPEELILLSKFNAVNNIFSPNVDLFSKEKLQNLQGREIIVGTFDYRPYVAVDFQRLPLYHDHAEDNPTHLVHSDGTDIRVCHTFCELYNCTVQFDTSEKSEWGLTFANYSGYGLIGMILEDKIDMATAAYYPWYSTYMTIDMTSFLGRSGTTCLVPAPTRLVSWTLPLKPFQFTLWLAVCTCLLLETFSLVIARRFEETVQAGHNSWWSCIEFGYSTSLKLFISQSSNYIVKSTTVRTMLLACYMIDIIITSIYGGGLSSILTLPVLEEVADSLERLYSHNIPWTATSYGWVVSIVEQAENNPMLKQLLSNFVINSMDDMREKSKTENMGFIVDRMTFGHFGNDDFVTPEALDRLKLMVDDVYSDFIVSTVSHLWVHLPKYNDLILAWHSSGFDKFWEWKIAAEYLNVNTQNQIQASMHTNFKAGPAKLDIKNFAGLIIIWCVGICVSILIFMGELIAYKMKQKLRMQNLSDKCNKIRGKLTQTHKKSKSNSRLIYRTQQIPGTTSQ